ncbi:hypothetical protein R6Q59_029553 [Mikania micrantha]
MRCGSNHKSRKGSRLLDKGLSCSSLLVSDVDSEENIEKENHVWVDERAKDTWQPSQMTCGHELSVAIIKEKCMD